MIERGFTLVELLIVIVILGILAGIVVFAVGNLTSNAKTNVRDEKTTIITEALESNKANTGEYDARTRWRGAHSAMDSRPATPRRRRRQLLEVGPGTTSTTAASTDAIRKRQVHRLSVPAAARNSARALESGRRPFPKVMFKNTVKTVVLLAGIGVLFMVVGSFFGTGGLIIGLALGIVFRRRVVLVLRQARREGRRRGARDGGRAAEALRHRPRPHVAHRHADAGDLHQPGRAAERLRDRPQPAPRRGRGHAGPAPGRRRGRAARRARPRARTSRTATS